MAADLTGTCCVVHSQKQGMSDLTRQRSGELQAPVMFEEPTHGRDA